MLVKEVRKLQGKFSKIVKDDHVFKIAFLFIEEAKMLETKSKNNILQGKFDRLLIQMSTVIWSQYSPSNVKRYYNDIG